jgi:membrane-associated protein
MLAGIVGGLVGDNVSYLLGARLGRPAARRFLRGERSRRRFEWAREQLRERGAVIILTARFVPVGRTATTFASGTLAMPWQRFAPIDAVAVTAWALYACLAGYFGGRALGLDGPAVLLAAIVFATVIGLAAEGVRRLARG